MSECIVRIAEYTGGDRSRFEGSRLVQDAVIRNLQTLRVFADDAPAIVGMRYEWSEKKQDYVVTHSWGPGERTRIAKEKCVDASKSK